LGSRDYLGFVRKFMREAVYSSLTGLPSEIRSVKSGKVAYAVCVLSHLAGIAVNYRAGAILEFQKRLVKYIRIPGMMPASDFGEVLVWLPSYEHETVRFLRVKKGDVFVDIGAHTGRYTVMASLMVGERGKVVAVEPDPSNFERLLANISLNRLKNVIPLRVAASDSDGTATLHRSIFSSGQSIGQDLGRGSIEVPTKTMDGVIREIGPGHVDWVKIDVEGFETEVLKGMKATILRYGPRIIVEVWRSSATDFLGDCGYAFEVISSSPQMRYLYCYPKDSGGRTSLRTTQD